MHVMEIVICDSTSHSIISCYDLEIIFVPKLHIDQVMPLKANESGNYESL